MSLSANISDLATEIKAKADAITSFLSQNGSDPTISFTLGSPMKTELPPELEIQKLEIYDAMNKMKVLLDGPLEHVISTTGPASFNPCLGMHSLEAFGIAEQVPFGTPVSLLDLASRCKLDPDDLTVFLRVAVASYVLEEPVPGLFQHNAASAVIAQSPEVRSWMRYVREDMLPAAMASFNATRHFPGSGDPAECGFSVALRDKEAAKAFLQDIASNNNKTAAAIPSTLDNGEEINSLIPESIDIKATQPPRLKLKGFFESLSTDAFRTVRFKHSMGILGAHPASDPLLLAAGLSAHLRPTDALLVDVGGSTGSVAAAIARQHAQLRLIVEDLPEVVASADAVCSDNLTAGRISFVAQDVLAETQKVVGADIYLFRQVLHNWSDNNAVRILRGLVPALKMGARIILNEVVLPRPDLPPTFLSRLAVGFSFAMKSLLNGRERDEEAWRILVTRADERFEVIKITTPRGSRLSIIEVLWKGRDME